MTPLFIQGYYKETIATLILFVIVIAIRIMVARLVKHYAKVSEVHEHRTNLVIKYISILITVLTGAALVIIWGVKAENLFTTLTGVLTIVGVALFAQWSVLSNITAGIILLFSFPFRIGDVIRIHDKDFPIEAEIEDIRAFHTLLKTKEGEFISYPNNLLLQKGVTILKGYYDDREFMD